MLFHIFADRCCPGQQAHCRRVERASIDEAYLDLTQEAAKLCQETEAGKGEDVANAPETDLQVGFGANVLLRGVGTIFALYRVGMPPKFRCCAFTKR